MVNNSFFRFLVSGGLNTLATWVLYLILLGFLSHLLSYSIAYVVGIFLSYAMNRYFVFGGGRSLSAMAAFPLVYVIQYLFGLLVVWLWVDRLGMGSAVAPLISTVLSIPLTYFLSKRIFGKKADHVDR